MFLEPPIKTHKTHKTQKRTRSNRHAPSPDAVGQVSRSAAFPRAGVLPRLAVAAIDRALAGGRAIPDLARVAVDVHRTAEKLAHEVASIARRMSEAN